MWKSAILVFAAFVIAGLTSGQRVVIRNAADSVDPTRIPCGDAATIDAAMAAAAPNSTIRLAAGTCNWTWLDVYGRDGKNLTIEGAGIGQTVIITDSGSNRMIRFPEQCP